MQAEIKRLPTGSTDASIDAARVLAVDTDGFLVETTTGTCTSRAAVGCLVTPMPGDWVLISSTPLGIHILSVLEREDPDSRTVIGLPGNALLRTPKNGTLEIEAAHLRFRAEHSMHQSSEDVQVSGKRLGLHFHEIRTLARELLATLDRLRTVCNLHDLVARSRRLFADHSERHVKGLDATRAGNVHMKAEKLVQLKGETLLSTAKKLYRVDGDQIHLG